MYTFTVKDKEYNLKLTTQEIINVEKKIGKNLVLIFGTDGSTIPTTEEMVTILFHSLITYQHNMKYTDACEVFDRWLGDGHTVTDFIQPMIEIFKESGIIKKDGTEKNV